MSEITRTIQIQVTVIGNEDEFILVGAKNKNLEDIIRDDFIENMGDADQILVDVKDFIREE